MHRFPRHIAIAATFISGMAATIASTPPEIPILSGGFPITLPPEASAGPFFVEVEFDSDPIVTGASLELVARVTSAANGTAQVMLNDTELLTAPVVANELTAIREVRDVLLCAEAADAEVGIRLVFRRRSDGMPLSVPKARLTVTDANGQILVDEPSR